jgi:hypothetical protein
MLCRLLLGLVYVDPETLTDPHRGKVAPIILREFTVSSPETPPPIKPQTVAPPFAARYISEAHAIKLGTWLTTNFGLRSMRYGPGVWEGIRGCKEQTLTPRRRSLDGLPGCGIMV